MNTLSGRHEPAGRARITPAVIGWPQRAWRHEFAAVQQFTLQAVVARRLGDAARASRGLDRVQRLFEEIGAEEAVHLDALTRRARSATGGAAIG